MRRSQAATDGSQPASSSSRIRSAMVVLVVELTAARFSSSMKVTMKRRPDRFAFALYSFRTDCGPIRLRKYAARSSSAVSITCGAMVYMAA